MRGIGCSPRNGNSCRIKECPDLNRSTGEVVQIKISQLFTKYLESLNCFKNFQMSTKTEKCTFHTILLVYLHFGGLFLGNIRWRIWEASFQGPTPLRETICSQKMNHIDRFGTSPGGCFEIPIQRWFNFDIKNTKIVQNRSLTIIDHQKLVIANFFVIHFYEM